MKLIDFDTIIFDLDDTIWSGSEPNLWAKKLTPPLSYTLNAPNRVYDFKGKYLELHDGVFDVLAELRSQNKNIGFSTIGGWKDVPYDWQPAAMVLKTFFIENYFGYAKIVQYKDGVKTKDFVPNGKTIFIDDNEKHLNEVKSIFPKVVTLNRNSFKSWKELL